MLEESSGTERFLKNLVFPDHITIVSNREIDQRIHVDVLADETNGTISQKEMGPSRMSAAERPVHEHLPRRNERARGSVLSNRSSQICFIPVRKSRVGSGSVPFEAVDRDIRHSSQRS